VPPIDYEREYDNRGRVPEHPEIFARWRREAAAYRAAARSAEFALPYGPSPRQTIDLFPAKDDDRMTPLALFIHGGWWRSLEPAMFSHLAAGPNARGLTVAIAGYDLCPTVSIATIIEQVRAACLFLWRKHKKRIFVHGHSAGGHLAACLVAQDWKSFASDPPADLVPAGYAISGVFDLSPLVHVSQNQDLRLDDAEARRVSPLYWKVPAGRALDAVVGGMESSEFLRQSRSIADNWHALGVAARYEEIAAMNHFTVVDALSDADSAMTRRVADLASGVNTIAL
jgi:arylformamidase